MEFELKSMKKSNLLISFYFVLLVCMSCSKTRKHSDQIILPPTPTPTHLDAEACLQNSAAKLEISQIEKDLSYLKNPRTVVLAMMISIEKTSKECAARLENE